MLRSTILLATGLVFGTCAASGLARAEQIYVTSYEAAHVFAGPLAPGLGGFHPLPSAWPNTPPFIHFRDSGTASTTETTIHVDGPYCCGGMTPFPVIVQALNAASRGDWKTANPVWMDASAPELFDITGRSIFADAIGGQRIDPADWMFMGEAEIFATNGGIPEPSSLAVLAVGLAGLALLIWTSRRRAG